MTDKPIAIAKRSFDIGFAIGVLEGLKIICPQHSKVIDEAIEKLEALCD